jgi:DNA-binding CsgD family transcriptional regulator
MLLVAARIPYFEVRKMASIKLAEQRCYRKPATCWSARVKDTNGADVSNNPVAPGNNALTACFTEASWTLIGEALRLSPRELQIVRRIVQDQKTNGIAAKLGISPHTVRAHLERIYLKTGVSSRVTLALCVFQTGMQELERQKAAASDTPAA